MITHLCMSIVFYFQLFDNPINDISIKFIDFNLSLLLDISMLLVTTWRHATIALNLIGTRPTAMHDIGMHVWSLMVVIIRVILMVWLKVTY